MGETGSPGARGLPVSVYCVCVCTSVFTAFPPSLPPSLPSSIPPSLYPSFLPPFLLSLHRVHQVNLETEVLQDREVNGAQMELPEHQEGLDLQGRG